MEVASGIDPEVQAAHCAWEASVGWNERRYTDALKSLESLLTHRPADPKVLHNKGLLEYLNGSVGVETLLKQLDSISKNNPLPAEITNDLPISPLVLTYNRAVLHLQLHRLEEAATLLVPALAYLPSLLSTCRTSQSFSLGAALAFVSADVHTCLALLPGTSAKASSAHLGVALDSVARVDEVLSQEEDASEKKAARPEEDEDGDKAACPAASLPDLRVSVHHHNARIYLLSKAIKNCQREVKFAMTAGQQSPASLLLKANLEYARGNLQKAVKLMNVFHRSAVGEDVLAASLYYNNMGCIHFRFRKFSAASFYFSRALKCNREAKGKGAGKPDFALLAASSTASLLYNIGLTLLKTHEPLLAFESFVEAAPQYSRSPLLWLRIAEAIIEVHTQKIEARLGAQQSDLVQEVKGSGKHQRVILPYRPLQGLAPPDFSDDEGANKQTEPTVTLEFASQCLWSCLYLCWCSPATPADRAIAAPQPDVAALQRCAYARLAYVCLALDNPISALHCSRKVLDSSPLPSEHASSNNSLPPPTSSQKQTLDTSSLTTPAGTGLSCTYAASLVCSMYAAEALCLLGKPTDALRYIQGSLTALQAEPMPPAHPSATTYPASRLLQPLSDLSDGALFPTARCALYTNLAVAHILQENFQAAQLNINLALSIMPSSPLSLLVQVYLELNKGNVDVALELLKRGRLNSVRPARGQKK